MMTVKKSNIRKEIDSQFDIQHQPEDIDDFENPFAGRYLLPLTFLIDPWP